MTDRDDARAAIEKTLAEVKRYLGRKLSEADTKHHFIEPLLDAMGWRGIENLTREYYVRSSHEFIDYVAYDASKPILAVEAKALQVGLDDKHASQLISYCAIEGIEWAALTNGRQLQFFNAFVPPDLAAKRLLRLDLLAPVTQDEYDNLFESLWLLSQESLITTTATRDWLEQRRLGSAIRSLLGDPTSATVQSLRDELRIKKNVNADAQKLAQWLGSRLESLDSGGQERVPTSAVPIRMQPQVSNTASVSAAAPQQAQPMPPSMRGKSQPQGKRYYGIRLGELIEHNILRPGVSLSLIVNGREVIKAELGQDGSIIWNGTHYYSPSDRAFVHHAGRQALNGWEHWHANLPGGRRSLADLRGEIEKLRRK